MYLLVEINEMIKGDLSEKITTKVCVNPNCDVEYNKFMKKFMFDYCINKVKEHSKIFNENKKLIDYIIEHKSQFKSAEDGFYFMMPRDNVIEIYELKSEEDGWIFSGKKNIQKLYTVLYQQKSKGKVVQVSGDKKTDRLFQDLKIKLNERRKFID